MRRVAGELGVKAMSLYNHIAGKDALLDGMLERVLDEVRLPVAGRDWEAELRRCALSLHDAIRRHPWASGLAMAPAALPFGARRARPVHRGHPADAPRRRLHSRAGLPRLPRARRPHRRHHNVGTRTHGRRPISRRGRATANRRRRLPLPARAFARTRSRPPERVRVRTRPRLRRPTTHARPVTSTSRGNRCYGEQVICGTVRSREHAAPRRSAGGLPWMDARPHR